MPQCTVATTSVRHCVTAPARQQWCAVRELPQWEGTLAQRRQIIVNLDALPLGLCLTTPLRLPYMEIGSNVTMNDLKPAALCPAMPSWHDLADRYADDASDCSGDKLAAAEPQALGSESDAGLSSEDEQDALEASVWADVYAGTANLVHASSLALTPRLSTWTLVPLHATGPSWRNIQCTIPNSILFHRLHSDCMGGLRRCDHRATMGH